MSIIVGLTGPTGAGKSSVAEVAERLGFKAVDCDKLARRAVERGTEGLAALTKVFGKEILNSDGTLNRKTLAASAFKSTESTELLNKTILPFIAELVKKEAVGFNTLLDAPTLFESGTDKMCIKTVAILADREIRLKRIMKRDSLNTDEAFLRLNAGKDEEFYKKKADYILYNNGEKDAVKMHFYDILKEITEENENG